MIRRTLAEQTAAHLIDEMGRGRWRGVLPGVNRLALDMGVSRETMRVALGLVEQRGLLSSQGRGRARVIVEGSREAVGRRGLRIAILLRESLDEEVNGGFLRLVLRIRRRIEGAGHLCVLPPKSQVGLGLNPARIIRMVQQTPADAWLVASGSLEVLEWFAGQPLPVLALGGRLKGLPIAGASRDPLPAFRMVYRKLIAMGHRRITLISGRERRQPSLSAIERTLQEEFATHGIPFGDFNVPDWEPTAEGLEILMRQLFRVTPPTVVQAHSPEVAVGVLSYLSRNGIRVPEDVSVICENMENAMLWHRPALAHFTTDFAVIIRRIARWLDRVAVGRPDRQQMACAAVFKPGESIGPPKLL